MEWPGRAALKRVDTWLVFRHARARESISDFSSRQPVAALLLACEENEAALWLPIRVPISKLPMALERVNVGVRKKQSVIYAGVTPTARPLRAPRFGVGWK